MTGSAMTLDTGGSLYSNHHGSLKVLVRELIPETIHFQMWTQKLVGQLIGIMLFLKNLTSRVHAQSRFTEATPYWPFANHMETHSI